MAKCLFNQCCRCIELRSGCLIIGYLSLIGSIIMVIGAAKLIGGSSDVAVSDKELRDKLKKAGVDEAGATTTIIVLMVIVIIISVAFFAISVLLLVGIHKGKRGHVKTVLLCMAIILVLSVIMLLAGFAQHPIDAGSICMHLFSIPLITYFFLVIRSYYYKMNDGSRQPAVNNTT